MAGDSRVDRDERFRDEGHRGAPPRGARQLTAILPNGRAVWLDVAAPLAPAASVSHVAALAEHVADARRSDSADQAAAIERLARTVAADAERLDESRLQRARALRRRIVDADNKLDERLSKARDEFRSRLDKQLEIDRENVRRLRRRDLWDKILIASTLPMFAAYGEPGNPFGANSLTLTLSLLIFLAGDQVVEALFGSDGSKSPYALDDADAWSYLAPVANVLAGWWLLSGRQHERFISGVTSIKLEKHRLRVRPGRPPFYRYRAAVDLRVVVAPDHMADFETFTDVPAVATIGAIRLSPSGTAIGPRIDRLKASVDGRFLNLSFVAVPQMGAATEPFPDLGEIDVAWMVDTDKPAKPPN